MEKIDRVTSKPPISDTKDIVSHPAASSSSASGKGLQNSTEKPVVSKGMIPRRFSSGMAPAYNSSIVSSSNSSNNNSSSHNNNNNSNSSSNSSNSGISSSSSVLGKKRSLDVEGDRWIMVTGLSSTTNQHVILAHFQQFGDIMEYNAARSNANWVLIKYALSGSARKAAQNELQICDSRPDVLFTVKLFQRIESKILKHIDDAVNNYDPQLDASIFRESSVDDPQTRENLTAKKYKAANVVSLDNYLQPRPKSSILGKIFEYFFN